MAFNQQPPASHSAESGHIAAHKPEMVVAYIIMVVYGILLGLGLGWFIWA